MRENENDSADFSTQPLSLKMARDGEMIGERMMGAVPRGEGGGGPFRRERKLNGLPLRAHSLFTRRKETNRVGTNKNTAKRKEESRESTKMG